MYSNYALKLHYFFIFSQADDIINIFRLFSFKIGTRKEDEVSTRTFEKRLVEVSVHLMKSL